MGSEPRLCGCGCGGVPKGAKSRFLPGHDHRVALARDGQHLRGSVVRGEPRPCECSCGGTTKGGRYLPGHDTRHLKQAAQAATGLSGSLLGTLLQSLEGDVEWELKRPKPRGRTLAAETNTLRAPLWAPSKRGEPVQLALRWEGVPYLRKEFRATMAAPLTVRDELLLTHIATEYYETQPDDRHLPFSLKQGCRWMGYPEDHQSRVAIKESLKRLRGVTIECEVQLPNGESEWLLWGLLDTAYSPRVGRRGFVTVNEVFAGLVRSGSLTLLDEPTFRGLVAADEVAARLWSFLESESLDRKPWSYALFAGAPGEPDMERNLPALADLLRLTDGHRRRVAARVRRAVEVVVQHDERYSGTALAHSGTGRWRLDARRGVIGVTANAGEGVSMESRRGVFPETRRGMSPVSRRTGSTVVSPVVSNRRSPRTREEETKSKTPANAFRASRREEQDTLEEWSFHSYMDDLLRQKPESERPAGWVHPADRRPASSGSSTEPRSDPGEPGVPPVPAPGVLRGAPVSGEPREQEEP